MDSFQAFVKSQFHLNHVVQEILQIVIVFVQVIDDARILQMSTFVVPPKNVGRLFPVFLQ